MKYIVTGATSCIGNAVCQYLLNSREDVIAVMRHGSAKEQEFLNQYVGYKDCLQVAYYDFAEIAKLQECVDTADVFINFAWLGTSKEQRNSPEVQQHNVECVLTAMSTAANLGCKVFIEAGSQAEYGWQNGELTSENALCEPFSEYGKAKLKSWQKGKVLAKELGISYVHLRIFSVYGKGEQQNTLIANCIKKMQNNEPIELTPCKQIWNYLYKDDAAEMIFKLAQHHVVGEPTQEVYNIASLDTRPLRNFIEEIKNVTNYNIKPVYGAIQPKRLLHLNPNMDKTMSVVGKLNFTPFAEGISKETEYINESI